MYHVDVFYAKTSTQTVLVPTVLD